MELITECKVTPPGRLGLPADGIDAFLSELDRAGICLHSALILRRGKIAAEVYSPRFGAGAKHRMYSVSKSFTSAAIGCLADEGKISLDDRIIRFFPEYDTPALHPYIRMTTVKNLLTMSTPFNDTTYSPSDKNWTESFFTAQPSHRPGTVFHYDTSATLILDAIVLRVSGMQFTEYLYKKVLKHIGFSEAPCCVCAPEGVEWGGSGVRCTARELAAFAVLMMNGGRAPDGTQLISESFVKEATSKQISNECDNGFAKCYCHGYGYQIWRHAKGFSFLGMGNQLAIAYPESDILFVCTADTQGHAVSREIIFRSFETNVVGRAADYELPGEEINTKELPDFPVPHGEAHSETEEKIGGRTFELEPNRQGLKSVRFDFGENGCLLTYDTDRGTKELAFGLGRYADGLFPETHYFGETIGTPSNRKFSCAAAGAWAESDKLVIRCYVTDFCLGNFTVTVSFRHGVPDIYMTKTAEWFLDEYRGFATGKMPE